MKHKFDREKFRENKKREKAIRETPDRLRQMWEKDNKGKPPWAKGKDKDKSWK